MKDVLFVDSGDPWNPRPETVDKVMAVLQGVHRVLKPDGIFISITFGQVLAMGPYYFSFVCSSFVISFNLICCILISTATF